MGRDTIQLENAVSTISQEYLLKFTSEFGIPESLHPELAYKHPEGRDAVRRLLFRGGRSDFEHTPYLISAPNPTKVKIETRPRAAHEMPLLTATPSRVIDMGDTAVASGSSGTPAAIEKSSLDFADEDPPQVSTERGDEATAEVIPESDLWKEVAAMGTVMNKRRHKRGNEGAEANAPPKVDSTGFTPGAQETPATAKSMSDPDQLSDADPRPIPEQDIA
nr:hypothetical protein [Tanacetum cinerariifolium]